MNGDCDLLADCAARLIAAGLDAVIVRLVIGALRHDWGGERHYIPLSDRAARDTEISGLLRNGVSISAIATRIGISRNTVRKVIRQDEWSL
ncbi:MAG TPA: helix-turn-helix domain-containing protein [Candidatus Competibacteraceae bacterium]|nr:helix-turn-helix domain-containing protein [Candidatus Competibacteraceae bacterium]